MTIIFTLKKYPRRPVGRIVVGTIIIISVIHNVHDVILCTVLHFTFFNVYNVICHYFTAQLCIFLVTLVVCQLQNTSH